MVTSRMRFLNRIFDIHDLVNNLEHRFMDYLSLLFDI